MQTVLRSLLLAATLICATQAHAPQATNQHRRWHPHPGRHPHHPAVLKVDTSQRLLHPIAFTDESTPTSRAKPNGVMGCELWVKIGDPAPAGPDDVAFLALATRTPDREDFDAADGGKSAHYMARWVNTRGQKGPWSAVVKATIAA